MRRLAALVFVMACGGSGKEQVQVATICPAGSILDPSKQQCIAMEPTKPVVAIPEPETSASVAVAVSVTPPPPPPPPPTSGFAIDVKCTFPQGWVALLPAAKYPKDDQFLMQSLIGLTSDPHFGAGSPSTHRSNRTPRNAALRRRRRASLRRRPAITTCSRAKKARSRRVASTTRTACVAR